MENKCAERYHLIAVTSAKVGKKQTASSQVSEQRDGMPPSDKERKKREGEKRANKPYPVEISTEVMRKQGTLFCRISQSCAGTYAAEVLVLRLQFRWIIHPGGCISPLK
jgi:hypothetical protein